MKLQLVGLLKHPRAIDYYDNITTLLTDLGASQHDVRNLILVAPEGIYFRRFWSVEQSNSELGGNSDGKTKTATRNLGRKRRSQ